MIPQSFLDSAKIYPGSKQSITINSISGSLMLYKTPISDKKTVISGYTTGLHMFHPQNDLGGEFCKSVLQKVNIALSDTFLNIGACHSDTILLNESGICDAIISDRSPITLAPADCNGIMFINKT